MARDLDSMEDDNPIDEDFQGTQTGTCPVCFEPVFGDDIYCCIECQNQDEDNDGD